MDLRRSGWGGLLAVWAQLLALLLAGAAGAQGDAGQQSLMFSPPSGFYLQPGDMRRRGELYGPTAPAALANWNVSQWAIPDDLPPFDAAGRSSNRWASVIFGKNGFVFQQNSANVPCLMRYPSGHELPREWAMFAAPNGGQEPGFPSAIVDTRESLGGLRAIELTTAVDLQALRAFDQACCVTKAFVVADVVLADRSSHQLFFYGVGLTDFLLDKAGAFMPARRRPGQTGTMYFKGVNEESGGRNTFGYGDSILASYGQPELTVGQPSVFRLNLWPHIVAVIRQAQPLGMDQDLDDWQLNGFYEGQTITGHVFIQTSWSKFSLVLIRR